MRDLLRSRQDHIFLKFTNFVTPGMIYGGNVEKIGEGETQDTSVKLEVFRNTEVPGINVDNFETKQVRGDMSGRFGCAFICD